MTRLRAATPMDAGAVGAILSQFVDTTPWMPRRHSRAEELSFADAMIARGWVTIAEGDAGIAGFAACDRSELNALYVVRAARGKGVGSALLRHVMAPRPALELWTFAANVPAQRFYEKHGFAEVARGDGSATDEGLPDIRYRWKREAA